MTQIHIVRNVRAPFGAHHKSIRVVIRVYFHIILNLFNSQSFKGLWLKMKKMSESILNKFCLRKMYCENYKRSLRATQCVPLDTNPITYILTGKVLGFKSEVNVIKIIKTGNACIYLMYLEMFLNENSWTQLLFFQTERG